MADGKTKGGDGKGSSKRGGKTVYTSGSKRKRDGRMVKK